ncbi:uncharacterized protein LOC107788765 [Nicotiana tabacum]|uniref:Uncharacterized protein LOC107788765 n=2 Tax=Nicotiana tabacum TaxID=4097 RepID=A0AC58UCL1_TOBAC|nr:PREDICTED: uncharacterized protein LOC107788765 [Nicotiana tabacum]
MMVVSGPACAHLNYSIGYLLPPISTVFRLMEHGLVSPEREKKVLEKKKQRKQNQIRTGTRVKSLPPLISSKPQSSKVLQQESKNGDVKSKTRLKLITMTKMISYLVQRGEKVVSG